MKAIDHYDSDRPVLRNTKGTTAERDVLVFGHLYDLLKWRNKHRPTCKELVCPVMVSEKIIPDGKDGILRRPQGNGPIISAPNKIYFLRPRIVDRMKTS